jgi:hypothetical protein
MARRHGPEQECDPFRHLAQTYHGIFPRFIGGHCLSSFPLRVGTKSRSALVENVYEDVAGMVIKRVTCGAARCLSLEEREHGPSRAYGDHPLCVPVHAMQVACGA